jgi:uncharacterized protein YqgC (DUF456 family)
VENAQSLFLIFTLVAMIGVVLASIIPFVPGAILTWALAMVYSLSTQSVSTPIMIVMSLLMIAGATGDYWLPIIGVRGQGLSCLGAIGSFVGGIAGTLLIPIPILGTIMGSLVGAMLVEFTRIRQLRHALQAGRTTIKLYLLGVLVQFSISLTILLVFAASLLTAS